MNQLIFWFTFFRVFSFLDWGTVLEKKPVTQQSTLIPYFSGILLAALFFYIDLQVELGVAGGVPYVAVILAGYRSRQRSMVIQFAIISSVLILLGWYLSPPGGEFWKVTSNRFLALFAIGVTVFLCLYAQKFNEQMVQSQTDLDTIFNSVPAMIWYKDGHNRLVRVNQYTQDLTDIPIEDLQGQPMETHFPDLAEKCHLGDLEVMRTGKPIYGAIAEVKTAQGPRWLKVDKVPYRGKEGVIQGVIMFAVDITESRKAQEQLLLLFTAIEQGQTAVMITDNKGKIKYVNPSFCQNSGYGVEELVGENPNILKSGAHSEEFYADLWSTLNSGKIWRGEIINQAKNGVRYIDRVTIHPIWDSEERITHYVWVRSDDIQHQETVDQLRQYARELARSNRELEEFAAIASHDIQEPLRKIAAFGEKLVEDYEPLLDERGRNYLDRMVQASERLQVLVRDLIAFARVTQSVQSITQVDLNRLLDEVMLDLEVSIEESEAVVERGTLPMIEGNRTQLHQLFQNLVGNALKFHKKNTPPRVTLSWREIMTGEYEFTVMDNGIGFDEKYLERVFRPFERLHTLLEGYRGSGIGLALCKKIAEAHGGTITAKSRPGEGSTFIIRLPATQGNPKNDPADLI